MTNNYYKKIKKSFEKKHVKDIKIFIKKKKKLSVSIIVSVIKNLSEEQKQKQVQYMRNYHFAHKK